MCRNLQLYRLGARRRMIFPNAVEVLRPPFTLSALSSSVAPVMPEECPHSFTNTVETRLQSRTQG
jgi:hypothetical protein